MIAVAPWKLQELTYRQVRETHYEVAILPLGSCEPHNFHIPYGSDAFHAEKIADRLCEAATALGAKVIQLPTVPYGVDSNLMGFPLVMNVYPSTLHNFVRDIVKSLEHHGIFKLVILNGHGGNDFKTFLREMYGRTKVFIALVDWWKVGADTYSQIFENPDDHAGEMETSIDLTLFGELIHLEEASEGKARTTRFEAINKGWVQITRPWHLLTESSGVGDPRRASAEKGEKYLAVVVDRISRFIKELSDAQMDERFPY